MKYAESHSVLPVSLSLSLFHSRHCVTVYLHTSQHSSHTIRHTHTYTHIPTHTQIEANTRLLDDAKIVFSYLS